MKTFKIILVLIFLTLHDLMHAQVPDFDDDTLDNPAAPIDQSWSLVILSLLMLGYVYFKVSRNFSKK